MSTTTLAKSSQVSGKMSKSVLPSITMRLLCCYLLIVVLVSVSLYDMASAASKKFIKGFILGALLAKNHHYPVVVESHKHSKY